MRTQKETTGTSADRGKFVGDPEVIAEGPTVPRHRKPGLTHYSILLACPHDFRYNASWELLHPAGLLRGVSKMKKTIIAVPVL
jgi:hypothetical protein